MNTATKGSITALGKQGFGSGNNKCSMTEWQSAPGNIFCVSELCLVINLS